MKELKCEYFCNYIKLEEDEEYYYLIMEYCDGQTLKDLLIREGTKK
jgi:serine/threonine protein kinase